MKYCVLIPARAGSKGVKNKNKRICAGKPLINYTIEAAQASFKSNDIFISTNDHDIVDICKNLNINTSYKRPDSLAQSDSKMIDVVKDFASWLNANNQDYDNIILLQVTSPLRTSTHINEAVSLFDKKRNDHINLLVSVVEVPHNFICDSQYQETYGDTICGSNERISTRQNKTKYIARNGPAILIMNRNFILNTESFYSNDFIIYRMDRLSSIDIDDENDFITAEYLLNIFRK